MKGREEYSEISWSSSSYLLALRRIRLRAVDETDRIYGGRGYERHSFTEDKQRLPCEENVFHSEELCRVYEIDWDFHWLRDRECQRVSREHTQRDLHRAFACDRRMR